ncbi:hypothetical protein [Streptosporangium sp. NPDC020145]|uniref:hypothetical protein n=1 Tax=Streptosporangium sp. NPDC020145 TaxID=3154694 RepID=UPI00342A9F02
MNDHFPAVTPSTEEWAWRQREERKGAIRRDPVITTIRTRPTDRGHWQADRAIDLLARVPLTEAQKERLRELLG